MLRGEIWWADLREDNGSAPAYRRPVLVVQSNAFNRSQINTIIVAVLTSNLALAKSPGNVLLSRRASGLPRDSVVNISQLAAVDRSELTERVNRLPGPLMQAVDQGLRLVLDL